jgi:hypothetical protein
MVKSMITSYALSKGDCERVINDLDNQLIRIYLYLANNRQLNEFLIME